MPASGLRLIDDDGDLNILGFGVGIDGDGDAERGGVGGMDRENLGSVLEEPPLAGDSDLTGARRAGRRVKRTSSPGQSPTPTYPHTRATNEEVAMVAMVAMS